MRLPTPAEIGDFESEGIFTVRHGINAVCSHVDGEIFSINYGEFSTWVEDSPDSKKRTRNGFDCSLRITRKF